MSLLFGRVLLLEITSFVQIPENYDVDLKIVKPIRGEQVRTFGGSFGSPYKKVFDGGFNDLTGLLFTSGALMASCDGATFKNFVLVQPTHQENGVSQLFCDGAKNVLFENISVVLPENQGVQLARACTGCTFRNVTITSSQTTLSSQSLFYTSQSCQNCDVKLLIVNVSLILNVKSFAGVSNSFSGTINDFEQFGSLQVNDQSNVAVIALEVKNALLQKVLSYVEFDFRSSVKSTFVCASCNNVTIQQFVFPVAPLNQLPNQTLMQGVLASQSQVSLNKLLMHDQQAGIVGVDSGFFADAANFPFLESQQFAYALGFPVRNEFEDKVYPKEERNDKSSCGQNAGCSGNGACEAGSVRKFVISKKLIVETTFQCRCKAEFAGASCQSSCRIDVCGNRGDCVDEAGKAEKVCKCDAGYGGAGCAGCAEGFILSGAVCVANNVKAESKALVYGLVAGLVILIIVIIVIIIVFLVCSRKKRQSPAEDVQQSGQNVLSSALRSVPTADTLQTPGTIEGQKRRRVTKHRQVEDPEVNQPGAGKYATGQDLPKQIGVAKRPESQATNVAGGGRKVSNARDFASLDGKQPDQEDQYIDDEPQVEIN